jgi:hypothetical protein
MRELSTFGRQDADGSVFRAIAHTETAAHASIRVQRGAPPSRTQRTHRAWAGHYATVAEDALAGQAVLHIQLGLGNRSRLWLQRLRLTGRNAGHIRTPVTGRLRRLQLRQLAIFPLNDAVRARARAVAASRAYLCELRNGARGAYESELCRLESEELASGYHVSPKQITCRSNNDRLRAEHLSSRVYDSHSWRSERIWRDYLTSASSSASCSAGSLDFRRGCLLPILM